MLRAVFVYGSIAVFVYTLLVFVLPLKMRVRSQAIWAMALLACFSKFLVYRELGGDAFAPELPEYLIWGWNWAYSGAMMLSVLATVRLLLAAVHIPVSWLGVTTLSVIAWGVAAYGVWGGVRAPVVRETEIASSRVPSELDGYRIVQIADLHASAAATRWRTESVVGKVNSLNADLVVCTGDIVDGEPGAQAKNVEPLGRLSAKDGVWFVTGNHEYYNHWLDWKRYYDEWGIRFLENEWISPHEKLVVAGVSDIEVRGTRTGPEPKVDLALRGSPRDGFRILLQHRPCWGDVNCEKYEIDLQLSGHTHGGVMPFVDRLVARINQGFVRGYYAFADGRGLFVSPGCGQWAGFPVRFFNPPEINVLVLRSSTTRR